MPDTKEVKEVERPLTAEEKAEVQAYQAKKAREEELEKMSKKKEKARSNDDLLEAAYEKLSVIDADLKAEIEAYFYDNGRWEKPEIEEPVDAEEEAKKDDEKKPATSGAEVKK